MGAVLQADFRREPARPRHLMTMFCVQAYWRDRDKLAKGAFAQHANMEAALRAGKVAERRSAAVLVYRVRGNVAAQYWEEPVVIARLGEAREELPPPPAPGFV